MSGSETAAGRELGATENARPENDGVENDGQIPKELQGLENAGLENDVLYRAN